MKYFLIIVSFIILLILTPCTFAQEDTGQGNNYSGIEAKAKVINIIKEYREQSLSEFSQDQKTQIVKVKMLSGDLAGEEFTAKNMLSGNPAYDINLKAGDEVIVEIETGQDGEFIVNITNHYRMPVLLLVTGIFVVFVLIFGGIKGFKSLIALVLTYTIIFYFLVPGILAGHSPLLLTVITSIAASCTSILIVSGMNLKSFSAIIGTTGGVIAAGAIALMTIKLAKLTGLPKEEAINLWVFNKSLDFTGILASSMIIGALGAAIDVGISIASSVYEVKVANPEATISYLYKAGMSVGKDIMGANTTTLLLAYTGSALFLLLLVYGNVSMLKLLNLDSITSEIAAALAGSIGIVLCIPITAIASGYLLNLQPRKKLESDHYEHNK